MTERLATAALELTTDQTQFNAGLADAEKRVKSTFANAAKDLKAFGRSATDAGKTLSIGLTAPIVAVGAAAIKFGTEINEAMANVATLIPGAGARVQELKRHVQDLAIETGKSTTDMAGGLYQVISAFGDTADTVAILRTNAMAAAAGLSTTEEAIALTSAVTKGYGDTSAAAVQQAADLALQTVKLGQTTFPELAGAIGRVVPLAAELKVTQAELFGVMATGTGVTGTASEVSSQLRGIFQSLLAPTKDMTGLLRDMGVESGKALLEQKGLKGTIEAIIGAANTAGVPLQKFIGSIEGQTLALALAGPQADVLAEKITAMSSAAGTTDEAFREQAEGVNAAGFAWQQFKQEAIVAMQRMGDIVIPILMDAAKALRPVGDLLKSAMSAFQELPKPVQAAAVVLGGLLAAIGPVLLIVGQLAFALSAILPWFAAGTTGATVLGTAFTVLTGPIGLAAAAIAGLAVVWFKWGDDITRIVNHVFGVIRAWFVDQFGPIVAPVLALLQSLGEMFQAFGMLVGAVVALAAEKVGAFASSVISWLRDKLSPVIEPMLVLVRGIASVFSDVSTKAIGFAKSLYEGVKGWLLDKFTAVVDGIRAKVDAVTGFFKGMYDKVVGNSYVPDMVNRIAQEMARLQTVMVAPALQATTMTADAFKNMGTSIDIGALAPAKGKFSGFIDAIKQGITGGEGIKGMLGPVMQGITSKFGSGWGTVFQAGTAVARAFAGDFSGVVQLVSQHFDKVVKFIGEGVKKIGRWFKGLFGGASAKELGGREVAGAFRDTVASMMNERQTVEAGNNEWAKSVIVVRDAYLAMGKTEAEALAAMDRLWKAEKEGAGAVEEAIKPIQAALDFVKTKSEETGLSLDELRAKGMGAGAAVTSSIADVGRQLDIVGSMGDRAAESLRESLGRLSFEIPVGFKPGAGGVPSMPAIPMAAGGFGRVTRPTLFMAGEAGAEDFAFSGGGKSFGGGGGSPDWSRAVVHLDGRKVGFALVPHLPSAAGAFA